MADKVTANSNASDILPLQPSENEKICSPEQILAQLSLQTTTNNQLMSTISQLQSKLSGQVERIKGGLPSDSLDNVEYIKIISEYEYIVQLLMSLLPSSVTGKDAKTDESGEIGLVMQPQPQQQPIILESNEKYYELYREYTKLYDLYQKSVETMKETLQKLNDTNPTESLAELDK